MAPPSYTPMSTSSSASGRFSSADVGDREDLKVSDRPPVWVRFPDKRGHRVLGSTPPRHRSGHTFARVPIRTRAGWYTPAARRTLRESDGMSVARGQVPCRHRLQKASACTCARTVERALRCVVGATAGSVYAARSAAAREPSGSVARLGAGTS